MRTIDTEKSSTEVRQADHKRGTLWMVIIGIVVLGLIFFGMWWWYAVTTPPSAG